jgi:tol-pal system protein YbgF
MFSFGNDDAEAAAKSDSIALSTPTRPAGKPTRVASVHPTPAADMDPVPAALAGTKTSGPKEDPMKMYQRAFGLFQKKEWGDAMLSFESFVRVYPSHEYADNAYYWMGECFYAQAEYALAIEEFQKIPELYPGGNKVPDALLKIGLAYQSMSNTKSAARIWRQLVDAYPQSEAAELGRQRLAKLPQ